jgi:hypothetical protein
VRDWKEEQKRIRKKRKGKGSRLSSLWLLSLPFLPSPQRSSLYHRLGWRREEMSTEKMEKEKEIKREEKNDEERKTQ